MKSIVKLFFCLFIHFYYNNHSCAQSYEYFQQDVDYDIKIEVKSLKDISVDLQVNYINNSPTQLDTLYFHLWMNAFSTKNSPYSKQILKAGDRFFYFYSPSELGGYSNIECKSKNENCEIEYLDSSKEIAFIILKKPLLSKNSISFNFKYDLTLPKMSGRIGWDEDMAKLIHWFPRFAVYDQNGWNTMPYLSWGEFYGEYCNFNLTFSTPDSLFVVGPNGYFYPDIPGNELKIQKVIDVPLTIYRRESWMLKTSQYEFLTEGKSARKKKLINTHYYRNHETWQHAVEYAHEVINFYEEEIGPFPFPALTICQGPSYQGGAMEYPGMIIINGNGSKKELQYLIAHEIAHLYFYGALGFNERKEPYMDEGLATFYEDKFTRFKYGESHYNQTLPKFLRANDNISLGQKAYIHQCKLHMHQPMNTDATQSTAINYGLNSYPKASYMWKNIELYLGKTTFKECIQNIYKTRRETHLNHKSMMALIRKYSGKPLDFVHAITSDEKIDLSVKTINGKKYLSSEYTTPLPVIVRANSLDTCLILRGGLYPLEGTLLDKSLILDPYYLYNDLNRKDNLHNPKRPVSLEWLGRVDDINKTELFILPTINFNTSNSLSPGFAIYNSTFPSKSIRWMLNPGYSIKSKKLIGQSWLEYDWRPFKNKSSSLTPYIGIKSFAFQSSEKFDYDLSYLRTKFGLTYKISNAESPRLSNAFNLNWVRVDEERALFESSTEFNIQNITFQRLQLSYTCRNNNALTPKDMTVRLDFLPEYNMDENFLKLSTEYCQKFYFTAQKSFDIRLWASYFLTNSQRRSLSYNNQLVRGSEGLAYQSANDFMYDYYYLDRDDGSFNQSNSTQGGGFKTIFNNNRNLGQTNDFAFSANFKSDIPLQSIRNIPLKLFFDIGGYTTYSQGVKNYEYLYSGGLSLFILNGAIEANLPLINSQEINQIYKEEGGSFLKRFSLNVDLIKLNPWKFLNNFNFHL